MKVLLLFCGGTIVMRPSNEGPLKLSSQKETLKTILDFLPEIRKIAKVDIEFIANVDSSDISPEVWLKLGSVIEKNYSKYDGFVITHGTDTMAYSASALSFLLQDLGKPVVFTGAQLPGHIVGSDAQQNIVHALMCSTLDLSGVFLVFRDFLFEGVRVTKVSESKFQAFKTVGYTPLAEFCVDMKFLKTPLKRHSRSCFSKGEFEKDVAVLTLFPGITTRCIEMCLDSGVKGIVLCAFGAGNIPESLIEGFSLARKQEVPIVVTTQCRDGMTQMSLYQTGQNALDEGAIEAHDMSLEVSVVKLMWLLGQGVSYGEIGVLMKKNNVGEISEWLST